MKLLLPLSSFIMIIFLMGCECQDNYYGEPELTISYYNDSAIEIYHLDYDNRLIGKIDAAKPNVKYAIDLHKSSMRLLLKYQSGNDDTLVLNYVNEVNYSNKCSYFIEINDMDYTFTNNNPGIVKNLSVYRNNTNRGEKVGYTVALYQ